MGFSAQAAPFEAEENFDDATHFSQGGKLPDGWTQSAPADFQRNLGSYFGFGAHSGDYLIGMANGQPSGVIYTNPISLLGGKEAGMEFRLLMPGGMPASIRNLGLKVYVGTSADIAQMTELAARSAQANSSWAKMAVEFTPEADADYYFAIEITPGQLTGNCGAALFDSFYFYGEQKEEENPDPGPGEDPDPNPGVASNYEGMDQLDPNEENEAYCMELPYFENFSDPAHYDGKNLPAGWHSTGTRVWRTAAQNDLPAASGDYYMIIPENNMERDERAYTPFFYLKEGVVYTLSFASHQESTLYDSENGIRRITYVNVLVGTEQDAEFMPVTMEKISEDNPTGRWTYHDITFSPIKSGAYCFCFELEGLPFSGIAAIDDLKITSPEDLARPEAGFAVKGIHNLYNSCVLSMGEEPIRLINTSNYADRVEWETFGAEYTQLPNGDIDIFLPEDGEHAVRLKAINTKGERTSSKIFNVQHIGESQEFMALTGYEPNATMLGRNQQFVFATDPDWDFVSGFNHYYYVMAEYFQLPANSEFKINKISTWMDWLNYSESFYGNQTVLPVNVKLVAADYNGRPDESRVFGSLTGTMASIFGGAGTNETNGRDITFPEPVTVNGPFFVIIEFSPALCIDSPDPNVIRSYIAFTMARHPHRQSTMYVKPYNVPEGSAAQIGKWNALSELDPGLKGLGLAFQLWASYEPKAGSVAINGAGEITFGATYDGAQICVSGTHKGEWIAIYTLDGKCVATQQADETLTTIPAASIPSGIYLVKGNNGCAKLLK